MSDAKVQFETVDYDDAEPGKEARFGFICPKSGHYCSGLLIAGRTGLKRNGEGKNGGAPQWDWDGNRELPTFSPSINCIKCWHGYIRAGRCVDTSGKDEPEPPKRGS